MARRRATTTTRDRPATAGETTFRARRARLAARLVAVAVFMLAASLLLIPSLAPFTLPGRASTRVVTEVVAGPGGTTTRTVRTAEGPDGPSGVVAGSIDNVAGIVVIRLGLALLTAFLAAALAQRIWMGDLSVKVGPSGVELPAAAEATDRTTETVRRLMATVAQMGQTLESQGRAIDLLARDTEAVTRSLARLQRGIDGRDAFT
jgi:methyl-accepting chemotaxis protein